MASLFSYFRSSCSFRVRAVLAYLEQDYDYRSIHLLHAGGEQHFDDYKLLNPMAQVPTYLDEDIQLSQSVAIIEYLNAKFPDKEVIPKDILKAAKVREVTEIINSGIQPLQNLKLLQTLKKEFNMSDEQKSAWIIHVIENGFNAVEKKLLMNQKFCFEKFSMADAVLVPQVFNAIRFGVEMEKFPKILSIYENCMEQDYFKKAAPEMQPDTPKD